jgi:hypothetical protein
MPNLIYPLAKQSLLSQSPALDLDSNTIKAALVTGAYTYSASHQYYSSVSAAVIGTPATLTNKTVTEGVFDADDVTFSSVTGNQVTRILLYQDTGTASTSPLIALFDTAAAGLPITPNGGNITIAWSNDAARIFRI